MRRRDLIIGGFAVAGAVSAEALRPRRRLILLGSGRKIDTLLPREFADWSAEGSSGLVSPDQAGRLARTLYSEIIQRIYHEQGTEAAVMLLAAYGDTQSDLLQLHRPESCYPAVGFTIESSQPAVLKLPGSADLPVRQVVATTEGRRENIVYWTRIGEHLPLSASEQRTVRLENAMAGYVSDGILFRCSALGDSETCFQMLRKFIPGLLEATDRAARPALVGSQIAQRMA